MKQISEGEAASIAHEQTKSREHRREDQKRKGSRLRSRESASEETALLSAVLSVSSPNRVVGVIDNLQAVSYCVVDSQQLARLCGSLNHSVVGVLGGRKKL
jgi:hypothetical protein